MGAGHFVRHCVLSVRTEGMHRPTLGSDSESDNDVCAMERARATLGSDSESDNDVCAMERARDVLWASGGDPQFIRPLGEYWIARGGLSTWRGRIDVFIMRSA